MIDLSPIFQRRTFWLQIKRCNLDCGLRWISSVGERVLYHAHVPVSSFPSTATKTIYGQFNHILNEHAPFSGDLQKVKAVHCLLLKLNLNGFVSIWNKLLNLYSHKAGFALASNVFDCMPERDVVSYNTMVSASVRSNDEFSQAIHLYSKMKREIIQPNHITFSSLIGGLCRGDLLHSQVIHLGFNSNEFVGSSLVEKYAKEKRLDDAIRAFNEMSEPDLVSCNVIINGCALNNSKEHALRVFSLMMYQQNNWFDGFTLTSVIKTCSKPSHLYDGMCLHCLAIKSGLIFETPINNSLMTMYSKCERGMNSAKKLFPLIDSPNVISWTAIISGLMQNKRNVEAAGWYKQMLYKGVRENDFLFATVLSVYGNLADLDQGRKIHARITKSCFGRDISVMNALIDMYSKCGRLSDADLVFSTMEYRDVVSYTTMITCFGHHGKGNEAIGVLKKMMNESLGPDEVTFLACLCACSHSGLLDQGIDVFNIMINGYHLQPRKDHFSCIIDLLGRAGRLNEAKNFIMEMGFELDVVLWETLLGACYIHGEKELAEKSAKRLMALDPKRHDSYVLLANVYAKKELWYEKGEVRDRLSFDDLQKEVGSSWFVSQRC